MEFAGLPKYCDMYRYLLGRVEVADLDYVGITEDFAASLALFFRVFPHPNADAAMAAATSMHLNRAPEYEDPIAYLREHGILDQVVAAQRINYEIYEEAKARFRRLCKVHAVECP